MFKVIEKNCNSSQVPLTVYSVNTVSESFRYEAYFLFYINGQWVWESIDDYKPFVE